MFDLTNITSWPKPEPVVSFEELTLWLIDHAHARNWQTVAERLLRDFTITRKDVHD